MSLKSFVTFLMASGLAVLIGTLKLTPFDFVERWLLLGLSVAGFILLPLKFRVINRRYRFWLMSFIILGFVSIATNMAVHNLDVQSGVIGSLNQLSVIATVPFYLMLRDEERFSLVKKHVHRLGVILLLALALFHFQGGKFSYVGIVSSDVLEVTATKLNKNYLNLVFCLLLGRYIVTNRLLTLVYAGCFAGSNMLGDLQRAILVAFGVLLCYAILVNRNYKRVMQGVVIVGAIALVVVANDSSRSLFESKFSAVGKLFDSGERLEDFSLIARMEEAEIGMQGFRNQPVFGNGVIRNSLKPLVFGENTYFHLSDIGILGIAHAFGLLGLVIFGLQGLVVWRCKWDSSFDVGIKLFLGLIWLWSIVTGLSVLHPVVFVIGIMLHELSRDFQRKRFLKGGE